MVIVTDGLSGTAVSVVACSGAVWPCARTAAAAAVTAALVSRARRPILRAVCCIDVLSGAPAVASVRGRRRSRRPRDLRRRLRESVAEIIIGIPAGLRGRVGERANHAVVELGESGAGAPYERLRQIVR